MSQPATTVQYEQCGLDFFQLVSVQANVRYTAGISFPAASASVVTSTWYQTTLQIGAHNRIALARLPNDPTKARAVLARQVVDLSPGSKVSMNFDQPTVEKLGDRTLEQVLVEKLYPEASPSAVGPAQLFIFTTEAGSETTTLVVNLCAALWDATTIKNVLQRFMINLNTAVKAQRGEAVQKPPYSPYCKLAGWLKILQDSMENVETPEPKYLPMGNTEGANIVATIADILPLAEEETMELKDRRVSAELDGETVGLCRDIVESKGATLSGFGLACFVRSLAETYFQLNTDQSEVTIVQTSQIDPRNMIEEPRHYIHAIGIVTRGCTVNREEMDEANNIVHWLMQEATRSQQDIQNRLDRGEGKIKTLELLTGKLNSANAVPSILEIVDHGVYETVSEEWTIELGHRLDQCPHMSLVLHVEKATGQLKLEGQIGQNQGRIATEALFARWAELWKLVAGSSS